MQLANPTSGGGANGESLAEAHKLLSLNIHSMLAILTDIVVAQSGDHSLKLKLKNLSAQVL